MANSFENAFTVKITYDHSANDEMHDILNIRKCTSPAAESPVIAEIIKTLIDNKESFDILTSGRYKSSIDDFYFYTFVGRIQIHFDVNGTYKADWFEKITGIAFFKTNSGTYASADMHSISSNVNGKINEWLNRIQAGTLHM